MARKTQKTRSLSFGNVRKANLERCKGFHALEDWSLTDWGCALAGEVGEACNFIKKMRRGDTSVTKEDVAKELADVVLYADLLAARMKIDLGSAVKNKFNEVSVRRNSKVRIK